MSKVTICTCCLMSLLSFGTKAEDMAGKFSGGIGLNDEYVKSRLLSETGDISINGWLSLGLTKQCSFSIWGSQSVFSSSEGETDYGFACKNNFFSAETKFSADRFLFSDGTKLTRFSAALTWSEITLDLVHRTYDDSPTETSLNFDYLAYNADKLTVRAKVQYEAEGESSEILTGFIRADYKFEEDIIFNLRLVTPTLGQEDGSTGGEIIFSVTHEF